MTAPTSGGRTAPAAGADRDRIWTVLELLRWTTGHFEKLGIETPRLDAECLLASALGVDRMRLYIDFEKPVMDEERAVFRDLVRRRAGERIPVAHLLEQREFWSLPLRVTPDVLVPRPDTETLVSAALELLPDPEAPARVLDLGTGSGAVALALARERPAAVITATDISIKALKIAQENAETLGMATRIRFLRGDWTDALRGAWDCVVANPPYLALAERDGLAPELAHEPDRALFAGATGLEALDLLCREAPRLLGPQGGVAFEIGPDQAPAVSERLRAAGLTPAVRRDLAGRDRVVMGRAEAGTSAK